MEGVHLFVVPASAETHLHGTPPVIAGLDPAIDLVSQDSF
jgi:hypothetical protein